MPVKTLSAKARKKVRRAVADEQNRYGFLLIY